MTVRAQPVATPARSGNSIHVAYSNWYTESSPALTDTSNSGFRWAWRASSDHAGFRVQFPIYSRADILSHPPVCVAPPRCAIWNTGNLPDLNCSPSHRSPDWLAVTQRWTNPEFSAEPLTHWPTSSPASRSAHDLHAGGGPWGWTTSHCVFVFCGGLPPTMDVLVVAPCVVDSGGVGFLAASIFSHSRNRMVSITCLSVAIGCPSVPVPGRLLYAAALGGTKHHDPNVEDPRSV